MLGDGGCEQRLRVRGLVLFVVAVAAVADEVDDDVVTEAAPIGEREPDGRDRGLGLVGVHVDDRNVEALREVARVARRAAVAGVGREADLVVRDHVERAAGRVAGKSFEVERLGDLALAGERRVTVDEDRQRDRGVVVAVARRAVGLLGARASLDDRVDRFEMARVRRERHRDVAGARRARALGAEVVLHVAAPALLVHDDRLDRALAFELAEDHLVRTPDDVREHVEAAAVRHPDHDLVRAGVRTELDRLVEHRHHHVEAFDRELLLAEEGAAQVALHPLDLAEPAEEPHLLLRSERLPVAARLDRLPEPHALLVVGQVLDLVGDRAAVDLAQPRVHVGERLSFDVEAKERRGDARHQRRRQLWDQPLGLEGRIPGRLGAERVEVRGEMPVRAVRLDERHRGGDAADELVVGRAGPGLQPRGRCRRRRRGRLRDGCRMAVAAAVPLEAVEQAGEARLGSEQLFGGALEERPPLGRDSAGVIEILLEQQRRIARVQSIDLGPRHTTHCCSRERPFTRARAA